MTRTIVDISVLQTVPPSNLNRDDTGSPKTAIYGGTRRARVSSQAWKRATRVSFNDLLDSKELGTRTKRVVELLGERIIARAPEITAERAQELAEIAFAAASIKLTPPAKATKENPLPKESGYLLFLSSRQLDTVAELCITADTAENPKDALKAADVKQALDTSHSVDLALFGRMVADTAELNVDAACQVAHAISVHPATTEFDFYTAVDDHKNADQTEDSGAGMIGTVEFTSSTLFRYATIDVDALEKNLGDAEATRRAVEAFTRAFITSMPTGKQNTFANRTLPDGVVISVRDTQPVNLVGAFEDAITTEPRLQESAKRLAEHAQSIDEAFGTAPVASWVVRVGEATAALDVLAGREKTPLAEAIAQLGATVAERIASSS